MRKIILLLMLMGLCLYADGRTAFVNVEMDNHFEGYSLLKPYEQKYNKKNERAMQSEFQKEIEKEFAYSPNIGTALGCSVTLGFYLNTNSPKQDAILLESEEGCTHPDLVAKAEAAFNRAAKAFPKSDQIVRLRTTIHWERRNTRFDRCGESRLLAMDETVRIYSHCDEFVLHSSDFDGNDYVTFVNKRGPYSVLIQAQLSKMQKKEVREVAKELGLY